MTATARWTSSAARRSGRTAGRAPLPRRVVAVAAAPEETDPGPLAPVRRRRGLAAHLRLGGSHRPAPPDDRVLGIYACATGLGGIGLAVALRGLSAITSDAEPSWYEPALAAVGLSGVGLIVAAILTAQRERTPWLLLALATAPFMVNLALTVTAL